LEDVPYFDATAGLKRLIRVLQAAIAGLGIAKVDFLRGAGQIGPAASPAVLIGLVGATNEAI
jgi:hypothetical protein